MPRRVGRHRYTSAAPRNDRWINMTEKQKTHFGYQQVNVEDKADNVANVFHSVAGKYDLMNDLMSLGIHRYWKRFTINNSRVREGHHVLDIAGGTGDLAIAFSKRVGKTGSVTLSDINSSMLNIGREKLTNKGIIENINYVQADAEKLPFRENYFDCITIAFGLRNCTNKEAALASMFRVLKPGGQLMILEFSKPVLPVLEKVYDKYSFSILPKLGKFIANDAESYQYLAESIRMHPDQETLLQMLKDTGFENCRYHNLTGGIVALHRGYKL